MSEHTELPWKLIYATDSDEHAYIVNNAGQYIIKNIRIEVAEYIFRACNSFDDLLAACEKIMRLRGDLLEGATSMDEGALLTNGADAFDEIEAAIAKATK